MPLNEKGTKIMKAMKKQYGSKEGKKVFYASLNKKKIKGVKKLRVGGVGGRAKASAVERNTGLESQRRSNVNRQNFNRMRKDLVRQISPSTKPINRAGALVAGLVVPGGSFIYRDIVDSRSIFAPKPKRKPTQPITRDNGNQFVEPIKIPEIKTDPNIEKFIVKPKDDFLNFIAYNKGGLSGGVKSGPPPRSGPNPQVPPIKMKKGGLK